MTNRDTVPLLGGFKRGVVVLLAACLGFAASAAVAQGASEYQLGPGDLIQIHVYGEDDLSVQLRVEKDGSFSYPFLGEVAAQGKTVNELEEHIREALAGDYIVDPDVRVFVQEYRPFFVRGEVNNPGGYPYVPGLNVQKAGSLAGGFTGLASQGNIYVVRDETSNRQRREADLDTEVGPGDIVIVEEGFF